MKNRQLIIYGLTVIVLIILGIYLIDLSNNYTLENKRISEIINGVIKDSSIYQIKPIFKFYSLMGSALISGAFSIMVSVFFIRAINKRDKIEFEDKLKKFQEDTAKDAISSVFKRVIHDDFFEIIKKDLFNATAIRTDVRWDYDFSLNDKELMVLRRTITYKLENISDKDFDEEIKVIYQISSHSKTTDYELSVCNKGDKSFTNIEIDKPTGSDLFSIVKKIIPIKRDSYADIVFVITQEFNTNYAYETHQSRFAIINLELNANFPKDYRFDVSLNGLSSEARLMTDVLGKKTYKIEGAIYKGQAIEFVCEKIITAANKSVANIRV